VVFCLLFDPQISGFKTEPNVTGVWSASPFRPTLELVLRLHPDTRRVLFVSGSGEFDRTVLAIAKADVRDLESEGVELAYLPDVTISELLERLASLPEHAIVIQLSFSKDSADVRVDGPEILSKVASASTAPVYGVSNIVLGSGIVGGSLISIEDMGAGAADIGARILAGERPQDIPPQSVPNVLMFDWREMQRWGISEKSLPPGSIVQFVVPSFWDEYKWRIIAILTLCIFEALIIGLLLANRARRRQAERETERFASLVEAQHQRLEDLVTNVPGIVWEMRGEPGTASQSMDFVSGYIEKIVGYRPEEWLSAPDLWLTTLHEDDREWMPREIAKIFASGKGGVIQCRYRAKDGQVIWVEVHMSVTCNEAGEPVALRGVTMDITARKRFEDMLRKIAEGVPCSSSDEFVRSLARRLSDVLAVDFVFVGLLAGENNDRIKTVAALMDGEMRENIEYDLENTPCDSVLKFGLVSCASGVQSQFPRDQQLVEMGVESYLGMALRSLTGQTFGLVSVMGRAPIKNIETHESLLQIFASRAAAEMERQQAQESLQQTQSELAHIARVMITGELAATIAHEVNQPLTAMVANANATRRMLGNGKANLDEAREAIDDIIKDAHRASQVVGRIRSLLSKGPHRTRPLAINEVIEEVVAIVRNDLVGKKVSLRMELAHGLPKAEADRVEIQQVMLNLMMNAVEAMRNVEGEGRNLLIRTARDESGSVLVEVQDSGVGIASENLDRIFDAFYTTRPEGMGMGLSICRTIVEAHGGRLWAESIKDKGATFRFTLPTVAATETKAILETARED